MTALLPEGEIDTDTPPIGEEDLRQVLENATQSSAHTALDRVRQGFVTLRGGHRVGLCGSVVRRDGEIVTLRELGADALSTATAWGFIPRMRMDSPSALEQPSSTSVRRPT